MNFLSHYYFDRHKQNPEQVSGMVLPDLVKNARKDWNLHPHKRKHEFENDKGLNDIYIGWQRHLTVDRIFHSSEFFSLHTQTIYSEISPLLQTSPVRPSFLAHIALELMLDRLLIEKELINIDEFYILLANANQSTITKFLKLNGITEPAIFFDFFDKFIHTKYLNSYRETNNLMYSLTRICMRLWKDPLNETQKLQISDYLIQYQQNLSNNFMFIFEDIDLRLNDAP